MAHVALGLRRGGGALRGPLRQPRAAGLRREELDEKPAP